MADALMKILDEFKRMGTKEFWKEVLYWNTIKLSGRKMQPISGSDWLPMLTSVLLGILFIALIYLIHHLVFDK